MSKIQTATDYPGIGKKSQTSAIRPDQLVLQASEMPNIKKIILSEAWPAIAAMLR